MNPRLLLDALSPRDRRAVAIGGALLIAVVLGGRVPSWLSWRRAVLESAATAQEELSRAEAMLRAQPVRRVARIARERHALALVPALLEGETPALAGANLAALVSRLASDAGLRLGTVQVRRDSTVRAQFTRVGVRAEALGDVRGLAAFLTALERGPALLSIRSFSISQPELAAADDRAESLRLDIEVEGLVSNAGMKSEINHSTAKIDAPQS